MAYKFEQITLISKITINDYYKVHFENLSSIFWTTILDYDYFLNFLNSKYLPKKISANSIDKKKINEIKFFLSKLKHIKTNINLINKESILPQDLFFSYVTFSKILDIYNDYYTSSNIKISLLKWLSFIYDKNSISDIESKFLTNNEFLNDFIDLLIKDKISINNNKIYSLKIFWPDEFILALYFWKIVKNNTKSKILLDFSQANEQYDYSSWKNFISDNARFLSKYLDYCIFYWDYWYAINCLIRFLNKKAKKEELINIIDISNWEYIEYKFDKKNLENSISNFDNKYFKKTKINTMYNKNIIHPRMFPYKCYWSKCNFCTINSQNFFSYNEKFSYEYFIDKWIKYIKDNEIYTIVFSDEAIPPWQIINFAKKVIENKLNIIYQFRTRFNLIYTKEVCELLYNSWARFCWIWLESASSRVNEDIWNKGERNISLQDKLSIVHNFDSSWISLHIYSIMWFPTETKLETISTYNFLVKNINNSNHFTSTPNIFWLMRWSYIYNNLDKFWIDILQNDNNLLALNFDFIHKNWEKRDINFLNNLAEKIHVEQFVPWLKWNNEFYKYWFNARAFWDYIDRSSYFYKMKMIYKNNPYLLYRDINNDILNKDFNQILDSYFELSRWLQMMKENETASFYDWINFVSFDLPINYFNFFLEYSRKKTLKNNLLDNGIDWIKEKELIIFLLQNRILTHIKDGYANNI